MNTSRENRHLLKNCLFLEWVETRFPDLAQADPMFMRQLEVAFLSGWDAHKGASELSLDEDAAQSHP